MTTEELYEIYKGAENGVTTDSRKCGPGMLFFALRGENFDGNQYATEAINAGCVAAVVDDTKVNNVDGVIVVEDVLTSMQELAKMHRRTFDIPVLGLTGSNGKTTTKELVTAVLAKKYKVHATEGNLNNHIGVPLTLLSTPLDCEFLIVEMGANHIGEISYLVNITEPNLGIITNIGLAHLEGFGGKEGVKKGKKELFDYLRDIESTVFIHGDHQELLEISTGMNRVIFGTKEHLPEVRFIAQGNGRKFVWSENGYESDHKTIKLEGDYNLDNIAAAITIGRFFNVEKNDVETAISEYTPTNNRSQVYDTGNNEILLDAYNANPSSMEKAILSFEKNSNHPKLVILGDMRELGSHSRESHQMVVNLCKSLHLDSIFVGEEFMSVEDEEIKMRFYSTIDELMDNLREETLKNKSILLKGSRGMAMEQLLPLL
ncbi:MAG: UDP-N-acetylmuramoyl-tripeptide--D-alanyl-D-alanine ligase [Bacteroidetes bacterium]|nr:MAG: UDP-N-acetylmuramoyl-tripeptide--D-alanyl-D-alanine ligase [Bacteroidota bacterium]